jgi:tRNA(fMet)-specific endonuclease VapC
MSILLIDTDVFSFIFRGDSRASAYVSLVEGNRLSLSFMTIAELYQWAAVRNWGIEKINRLEQAFTNYLIIPIDIELCRTWGNLKAERQAIGKIIAPQDAWIAATALHYNLPLVTHNARDFQNIPGLDLRTVKL